MPGLSQVSRLRLVDILEAFRFFDVPDDEEQDYHLLMRKMDDEFLEWADSK